MTCIGIDLGTTKSCVAAWVKVKDRVEIVVNNLGERKSSSCVAFTASERHYGDIALNKMVKNPQNTITEIKRLMGRKFNDPLVQDDRFRWPFQVVDVGGKANVQVKYRDKERTFHPEEISAMLLQMARESAEAFLGGDVKDVVISVPASFNDAQRQATIDAGHIAGLNVLHIIDEPTAATLTYGLDCSKKSNILIYDLGGGTFDVSVVSIEPGMVFKVLATSGDTHLGGCDFDNKLVVHLANEFWNQTGKEINAKAALKLHLAAKRAKHVLTGLPETTVDIDNLMDDEDFITVLTRECFENLCTELFIKTMRLVVKVVGDAAVVIDEVVLVGGSTRIPKLKKMLQDAFPGTPLSEKINADEAVAFGAAVMAAHLGGNGRFKDLSLNDATSHPLGMDTASVVVPRCNAMHSTGEEHQAKATSNQVANAVNLFEGNHGTSNRKPSVLRIAVRPTEGGGGDSAPSKIKVEHDIQQNSTSDLAKSNVVDAQRSGLSLNEIKKCQEMAEEDRAADNLERSRVEASNQLEQYCYSMLSEVNNESSKFTEKQKQNAQGLSDKTLNWLSENKMASEDKFHEKSNKLQHRFSSLKMRATPSEQGPSASSAEIRKACNCQYVLRIVQVIAWMFQDFGSLLTSDEINVYMQWVGSVSGWAEKPKSCTCAVRHLVLESVEICCHSSAMHSAQPQVNTPTASEGHFSAPNDQTKILRKSELILKWEENYSSSRLNDDELGLVKELRNNILFWLKGGNTESKNIQMKDAAESVKVLKKIEKKLCPNEDRLITLVAERFPETCPGLCPDAIQWLDMYHNYAEKIPGFLASFFNKII